MDKFAGHHESSANSVPRHTPEVEESASESVRAADSASLPGSLKPKCNNKELYGFECIGCIWEMKCTKEVGRELEKESKMVMEKAESFEGEAEIRNDLIDSNTIKYGVQIFDNDIPPVEVDTCDVSDSGYRIGKRHWSIATLLKAIKDQNCICFDLPLSGIYLGGMPMVINNFEDFIFEAKRVQDVNMKHPIILDWRGFICDGWHRVAKAILNGDKTIKAYRLKKYIAPDYDSELENKEE